MKCYPQSIAYGDMLPNIKIGQNVTVLVDKDKEKMRSLEGKVSWVSETAKSSLLKLYRQKKLE